MKRKIRVHTIYYCTKCKSRNERLLPKEEDENKRTIGFCKQCGEENTMIVEARSASK